MVLPLAIKFARQKVNEGWKRLKQRFPNWAPRDFARGATKACEMFYLSLSRPLCTSLNFVMEKYCLEEMFVNRLRSHTSQCNILCNNCSLNSINLYGKIQRKFLSTFKEIKKKNSASLLILFDYGKIVILFYSQFLPGCWCES